MDNSLSDIGKVIDMDFEKFKGELVKQRVNVGTMNNLILLLQSTYHELKIRKDEINILYQKGHMTLEESEEVLKGIYAELFKIEEKVVYLKDTVKVLMNVD